MSNLATRNVAKTDSRSNNNDDDDNGASLRRAILEYFQSLVHPSPPPAPLTSPTKAATSASTPTTAGGAPPSSLPEQASQVVTTLLEVFPELQEPTQDSSNNNNTSSNSITPSLQERYDSYPVHVQRLSKLQGRVVSLEESLKMALQQQDHRKSPPLPTSAPATTTTEDGRTSTSSNSTSPRAAGIKRKDPPPSATTATSSARATKKKKSTTPAANQKSSTLTAPDDKAAAAVVKKEAPMVTWDERYQQLLFYQKGYGNCRVPLRYKAVPGLGLWVQRQRANYKAGRISSNLIQKLESINFDWTVNDRPVVPWEARYTELQAYQLEHGHTRVPRSHPTLGEWVHTQRSNHRRTTQEGASTKQRDRLAKLYAIGFEFTTKGARKTWDDRFEQLVDFRRTHGHVRVREWLKEKKRTTTTTDPETSNDEKSSGANDTQEPEDNNEATEEATKESQEVADKDKDEQRFGRWMEKQEASYWKFKRGDRSDKEMSAARYKKLDDIGFGTAFVEPPVLSAPSKRGRPRGGARRDEETWNARLEQLRAYKQVHGHCNVPANDRLNQQLGDWVKTQRKHYRALLAMEQSSLTTVRRKALEDLGFQWVLRPWMLKENRNAAKQAK